MEIWHILIAFGIISFIVEIFTVGFIFGSIGIGFLFSAIGSYCGLGITWQILLFSLGIALTYFLIKPFMTKYGYKTGEIKTNQEALIGKKALVTEDINQLDNTGRVSIDGDDWKAKTENNEIIKNGTTVEVVAIESIILIVKPLKK